MAQCTLCGAELTSVTGYPTKRRGSGFRAWCRDCTRERNKSDYLSKYSGTDKRRAVARQSHLRHKYNIDLEDYDKMFDEQGGTCAICGQVSHSKSMPHSELVVDHDHLTGRVRGLLCHSCNILLGKAKDNTTILHNAITYLNKETQHGRHQCIVSRSTGTGLHPSTDK